MEEHVHDGPQARHAPVSDAHEQIPNPITPAIGRVPGTWMPVRCMADQQVGRCRCGQVKPAYRKENAPGVILVRSGGIQDNKEPFSTASSFTGRRDAVWSSENNATPSMTRNYENQKKHSKK